MHRGQQKRIPAHTGQHKLQHVFGAYNWQSEEITYSLAVRKNSESFIAFLEEVLVRRYPHERVILVMDNVSYHRSRAAQAALSLFEHRVGVVWLPPYCADLNPIERYWRHLKDLACANRLHHSLEDLLASLRHSLALQNCSRNLARFQLAKYIP